MSRIKMEDGCLAIDGTIVPLPLPVAQAIAVGSGVAVRLEVPAGRTFNRNVLMLNGYGGTIWQIEEAPHGTQADKPFMNIWLSEQGELIAGNWNGVDYSVALDSGSITVRSFGK